MISLLINIMLMVQADTLSATGASFGDLYEPPPVAYSYDVPGWKICGIVLFLGLLLFVIWRIRIYRKNRYRRTAINGLMRLDKTSLSATQVFVILKKAAFKTYGRREVSQLYGKEWLQFLDKSGEKVALENYQQEIEASLYANEVLSPETAGRIIESAQNWIRSHA